MKKLNILTEQHSLENNADVVVVNGEPFFYKNSGLTRRVFANKEKTKVVKIPVDKFGQSYNDQEFDIWSKANLEKQAKLAQTEIQENGYIIQEYLHTIDDPETPLWLERDMTQEEIRFSKSCRSDVGYDKEGNLKCYDLHEYNQY